MNKQTFVDTQNLRLMLTKNPKLGLLFLSELYNENSGSDTNTLMAENIIGLLSSVIIGQNKIERIGNLSDNESNYDSTAVIMRQILEKPEFKSLIPYFSVVSIKENKKYKLVDSKKFIAEFNGLDILNQQSIAKLLAKTENQPIPFNNKIQCGADCAKDIYKKLKAKIDDEKDDPSIALPVINQLLKSTYYSVTYNRNVILIKMIN